MVYTYKALKMEINNDNQYNEELRLLEITIDLYGLCDVFSHLQFEGKNVAKTKSRYHSVVVTDYLVKEAQELIKMYLFYRSPTISS